MRREGKKGEWCIPHSQRNYQLWTKQEDNLTSLLHTNVTFSGADNVATSACSERPPRSDTTGRDRYL